jgi:hypothetical protein
MGEGDQDRGVIRGEVEARLCRCRGGRDTLCDAEVYKVVQFVEVGGPVGRFTRREMMEMKTFQVVEEDTSSGGGKPGSPSRVLDIVVTTGEEALAKGGEVRIKVLRRNERIIREVDRRDGEGSSGVNHRNRCDLKVCSAEAVKKDMLDRGFDEDGTTTAGGASRVICVVDGVEG